MSDFLSDEELAELEAELGELDDEPEAEGASEEALEEVPPRDEADRKAVEELAEEEPVQVDEDAELEAELNAIASGHEGDDGKDDEAMAEAAEPTKPEKDPADEKAEQKALAEKKREAEERARLAAETAKEKAVAASKDTDESDAFDRMFSDTGSTFDPRQLQKDLAINENLLDDAFISQAAMFAHYAGVAHRASRRADQLAHQVKLVEAKLDQEIRQEAADSGEKLTEAAIKNRILLDPRHRKITERHLDAKAVAAMTKDGCESFKQRRDMLIQVGANVREEQKGELRMKAARENVDDLKGRALDAMSK